MAMVISSKLRRFLKESLSYLLILFIAVALATAMRALLLASFKAPGYSMLPAIAGGDYILVNKMIPGPRVPVRWRGFFGGKDLRLRLLAGYREVRRNDVPVFNFPQLRWGAGGYEHGLAKRLYFIAWSARCCNSTTKNNLIIRTK
jgi:signal peptidase I